jgi:hypothetical protein
MSLDILRDDALRSRPEGVEVRASLPWIRSLPVWSVTELDLVIDDEPAGIVAVAIGERRVPPSALAFERGWWFVQDRLRLEVRRVLAPGSHRVSLAFRLAIPYLPGDPEAPLALPFRADRTLILDAPALASVARDVA